MTAHYDDTRSNHFAPRDDMTGGELAFDWRLTPRHSAYVRLARGYKAGGFNVSFAGVDFSRSNGLTREGDLVRSRVPHEPRERLCASTFADGRLRADVGAFVARRTDQQIKVPIQLVLGDPSSFLLVTANAERGDTTASRRASTGVRASARGEGRGRLLDTKIEEFSLFP